MQKPTKDFVQNRLYLINTMNTVIDEMAADSAVKETYRNIVKEIKSNKKRQFVSIEKNVDFVLSYAKDLQNPFDRSKRIMTQLGRYVRRQLEFDVTKVSDASLDALCNAINAKMVLATIKDMIKVCSGKELLDTYREMRGLGSCLEGENFYRAELYSMNPDKVSVVRYGDTARALLWTCDDGTKYSDRPYGNNHKHNTVLTTWLKTNGYKLVESREYGKMFVTLKYRKYMPSIDTFYNVKFNQADKTILMSNQPHPGSHRHDFSVVCVPGETATERCKHCRICVADFDEFKSEDGGFICDKCRNAGKK